MRTFLVLILMASPALGSVRTSVHSGRWGDALTWSQGLVPGPGDEVVIAAGSQVVYTDSDDLEDECARLTIEAGGSLTFGGAASGFQVGGNGSGTPGGILLGGLLAIPGGITVAIDPDGNASREEDGLTVLAGGRLTLLGSILHEGTVTGVTRDDSASDVVFTDSGLRDSIDISRSRLVWRSGLRKGRWYDIASIAGATLVLDYDSRSNAERLGEPDHRTGTASVSGLTVTGSGTAWTDAVASGSWWWCDADGEEARVRVRRVNSPTSLQLAQPYGGTGCSLPGPYTLRDENQPYPAVDVSERIQPGDTYRLILPAVLRSRNGSDTNFDEQIFVRIQNGGAYDFENASFESVGKEAWRAGEGSGVQIIGFDGKSDPGGRFDTVEIYRYGGDAGLEWEDSTDFDLDWLFLHWAHPLITTSNEGHGVKFEHNSPAFSFSNVRVRNARFDRTNDDFVWWSTTMRGTSGVYDSIGKFCPNTASGHSGDAIDTNDEIGSTGGQLRIERNLFANIGTQNGGSCISAAIGTATPQPAWTGEGWLARDNVCLNIQTTPCMAAGGGGFTWDREKIWAVNNVCASVHDDGIRGIPFLYQNQVLDYGLQRVSGNDGVNGVYQAHGNILRGAAREAGDDHAGAVMGVGLSLVAQANWAGTTWSATDNVLIASVIGMRVRSWSSPTYPAAGQALFSHNVIEGHPLNNSLVTGSGIFDTHIEPADFHVAVTDNIFELPTDSSRAGDGFDQAGQDTIDANVVRVPNAIAWGGNLVATRDYNVSTGIDPLALDFELKPGSGAWNVTTTDGDKPGPRFAGTLAYRLPFPVPGLVPAVDPEDDDRDNDGDSLIDRWDNCPARANPGWVDADGDGHGDACDPCPTPPGSNLPDFDQDGLDDACEVGPAVADVDNSGSVDGLDLARLVRAFASEAGQLAYDPRVDLDRDGMVDGGDLAILATDFGRSVASP